MIADGRIEAVLQNVRVKEIMPALRLKCGLAVTPTQQVKSWAEYCSFWANKSPGKEFFHRCEVHAVIP